MILIISDGLHEGVEALATYLQLHAGVHAGLALLNLSIWEGLDGGLLVVPRVPLRTVLVERGIVRIEGASSARIDPPVQENAKRPRPNIPKPTTASEPEFYAQLEERLPGLSERLRSFVASLSDIGVIPEFGKSLSLRWQSPQGPAISAGTIEPGGSVWLLKTVTDARAIGRQAAGERYLEKIARIINGTVKRSENGSIDVRIADGHAVRLPALLQSTDEWKKAIASLIEDVASSH
jgi:hypothetical protein